MDPVLRELKKIADQQTEINKKLDLAVTKDNLKKSLTETGYTFNTSRKAR